MQLIQQWLLKRSKDFKTEVFFFKYFLKGHRCTFFESNEMKILKYKKEVLTGYSRFR